MELVPGIVIAGRYRLERLLASGGMGTVWVARHLTLGSEVAIKFMLGDSTELSVARGRFEREARTASLIRHPNVVTVQDYGIEGQTPYIAMELLHGENLDEFLVRKKRVTLTELEPIISQISRGLRKAHETGIVHRDLKPSNIFLARDDSDGHEVVKILDFGIAKEIDATLGQHTKTTELMGSPHYMSPEQLRSTKKSDFRSDLWSLGVIIYRALTGVTPFPGDTLAEVMVQVFSGKWTPPTTVVPELPPTVDAFFQRAFARKPDDRYQSIHDLHNAFVAVVAGKPLPAPTAAAPAPNPTTTPLPFTASSSSPSWPSTVALSSQQVPPAPPLPVAAPVALAPTSDHEAPKVPTTFEPPKVPTTFGTPPSNATPNFGPAPSSNPGLSAPPDAVFGTAPKVPTTFGPAPSSNPGLSAPPDAVIGTGTLVGFGTSNTTANVAINWQDNSPPLVALPDDPTTEPLTNARQERPANLTFNTPPQASAADGQRQRTLAIAFIAALLVLVTIIVIATRGPADSTDKPSSTTENSSAPVVAPPAAASGTALTPDEIAAAVPDETPVEVIPNEPPTAAPSTTQTVKSNWKPIGKGQARLLIKAKNGVCKITVNASYYGVTPLDVMVDAGKVRIFCRMPTGATRSKELRVPEYRITQIEFEVKQ